jgi:hypothetical protein
MRKNNAVGLRFGALVVEADSGRRSSGGDVYWTCRCDCGEASVALMVNLRRGHHQSCGCQRAERYRVAMAAKRPPHCTVEGCAKPVHYRGICLMHYTRDRNHGDVHYLTPESVRRANNRVAQLSRVTSVKSTTYRKLHGRHEHRAIGEQIVGRPLRSDEHVHHIDGNRHNNAPENLAVLTAAEHAALHAKERRHG